MRNKEAGILPKAVWNTLLSDVPGTKRWVLPSNLERLSANAGRKPGIPGMATATQAVKPRGLGRAVSTLKVGADAAYTAGQLEALNRLGLVQS